MHLAIRASLASLVVFGGLAASPAAQAACGEVSQKQPASWRGDSDQRFLQNADYQTGASIVGMWAVKFMAGGAMIDFGYTQWHPDGTEFMNSGGHAPATQNYCMGVWKQIGPSHYRLQHYAISYDMSGVLNGKVSIKEDVTVDPSGRTYAGPFSIDVYDPKTGALLNHVAGQVTGQRITVN
jgi:hypothetical protein